MLVLFLKKYIIHPILSRWNSSLFLHKFCHIIKKILYSSSFIESETSIGSRIKSLGIESRVIIKERIVLSLITGFVFSLI
jgi:hypothetical protein